MARDYRRRALMSERAEIARRERDAPLLHAAGVLPPMPTIEERIERRQAAEGSIANWVEQ